MSENNETNIVNENNEPNGENNNEVAVEDKKPKKSVGREIFEWVYSIAIAVAIAFLIKGFLFDIVKVDGPSMEETLHNNDRLIVTKLGYQPHQGDIIILDSNYKKREVYFDKEAAKSGKEHLSGFDQFFRGFTLPKELSKVYYVKRIIATEGQTVNIEDGNVFVDGVKLDEPYIKGTTYPTDRNVEYPVTVSEGCVFVMGDNREHSTDSRVSTLGEVKKEAILGKAQIRLFPFNAMGSVYK